MRDQQDPEAGLQLRYIVDGNGPPLLLLHGLFDSAKTWDRLIPYLSSGFKLYAVDLPGFGKTPLPVHWDASLSGMVDAVSGFLDLQGFSKVSLVGSSMGGGLALALSEKYPHRIDRLALLNPYGLPILPLAVKGARKPVIGRLLPYFMGGTAIKRCAKIIFLRALDDKTLLTEAMLDDRIQAFRSLQGRKDLFRFLKGISLEEISKIDARLSDIRQPVLILWGKKDGWLSEDHCLHLKKKLLQSRVIPIPDCGHLPHMEKPEAVAAAISDFCRTS
ncbi:MAG: alpha/beta fold hydrolase [Nitrospiria bacterium]